MWVLCLLELPHSQDNTIELKKKEKIIEKYLLSVLHKNLCVCLLELPHSRDNSNELKKREKIIEKH